MADSKTDPCAAYRGRILAFANGEASEAQDPALGVHLAMCAICARRLAFDRADRERRARFYAEGGFPPERSGEFWSELSGRMRDHPAVPFWRRAPVLRIAASLLLVAAGVWIGILAGRGLRERARPETSRPEAVRGRRPPVPVVLEPDRFEAASNPLRPSVRYALPLLRQVSAREGGF